MNGSILLDRDGLTNLAEIKDRKLIAMELEAVGQGQLFYCILCFFREGQPRGLHRDAYFRSPDFGSSKYLACLSDDFQITDFDFCRIELLTGGITEGDRIF